MNEESRCGELQQLVREEEEEEPEETTINPGGEVTPPTTPAKSKPATTNKTNNYIPHASSQVLWESNTQTSPIISKTSSEQATSQGSMVSGKVNNTSHGINQQQLLQQSRLMYVNEKDKQRSNKSDFTGRSRQHRATPSAQVACKHHCFLSEVPDVRRMEQALLQLLEDFHSGNLRAFGKDCSMEQMTEIREQQERLARLHFEIGQQQPRHQDIGGDTSGDSSRGLGQSGANMRHLLHRLQQLSMCIEKLHNK
ncbi:uncharacterized protein LOC130666172 isoform X2 [Microplitis mediator]|uniref:uncharacterized protein LOC130666172 isoform X2 n=1 Tax=Microplitis mediator TaxID=375433 RepID=UPI002555E2C7|nr:uncharacterized protein LOC130666172 isoform X2 [Microplitis mediator]